ncbi:enoyl-CoA hydratase [Consotaella salsifontis]|uniref:Enoyl-CoA hydratase n=1 Tax=Consotaella salsifontis TaxID=1365950 RepID=A0A1T4RPR8_9HYPH|nr:enoyl-CoA hydratase [Consotaella salsifontis]SKA17964.1 enoyl-CoA hydratase [Consotaella salsifontis]
MAYETIRVEVRGRVGLVTLHRPAAMNAMSTTLLKELMQALVAFDKDQKIGAIVVTGSDKVFASGFDVKEMQSLDFPDIFYGDFPNEGERIADIRKPIIAAVAGFALGAGCELALACDILFAADSAKFGLPQITLGILPGMGGTQRLARSIGKAKTMDLCLTGRMMGAEEAERCGLVARVVPAANLLEEALRTADRISDFSLPAVMMAKEAVARAYETPLSEGLVAERRLFQAAFALDDRAEGMQAFVEKREAQFKNR